MAFPDLVDRLVREKRPSWQVYDGRHDPYRQRLEATFPQVDPEASCNDAWHLNAVGGSWVVAYGGAPARQREFYDSEAAACQAMYERVVAAGEAPVTAVGPDALPEPVRAFIAQLGATPREVRLGDVHVAVESDMAHRIVLTGAGYGLDYPSVRPPAAGRVRLRGAGLDDVCRLLVADLAARLLPWEPGESRWGLPRGLSDVERMERLAAHPVERVIAAYCGERPEEVLDEIGPPAAIDLLDETLLVLGRGPRWILLPTDGPDGVRFTDRDVDYVLARDGDEYVISHRRERTNADHEVLRIADLDEARTRLAELLT
ncbi:hypothetical protein IM660_07260 [Ruania alkalisoli]|uniref:Uncharacterized protein n=1 Tax=Ruania alkalisoli TaxID=2779775 RepID=A0A7M1SZ59_9MICO|nr:hypothetical protein [Ruania alkalisoli]QOR72032.1 hypothetical protein IM660_07260 [Ruania alkalisoli]